MLVIIAYLIVNNNCLLEVLVVHYVQLPPYEVALNSDVESNLTSVLEQLTIHPAETEVNQFLLLEESLIEAYVN